MFDDFDSIYSYSRKQAIGDGVLIDVSDVAKEAGIRHPVAVTAELYHGFIEPTEKEESHGQSLQGRLWDVLFVFTVHARNADSDTIHYDVIFLKEQDDGAIKDETQKLKAVCGPGDTLEPVITIMLPHES